MTTVEQTTIRAAVRDGIARGVAAIGLAGVALIHLLDLPGQLSETPYMFVLYLALMISSVALAGFLIHYVSLSSPFLVDALSYVAVIAGLALMRPEDLHPQERTTRVRGHLMAGFRYVWSTPELRRPLPSCR